MKKKIIDFISKYIEDILIVIGMTIIIVTNYQIHIYLGNYTLGISILWLGFKFAKGR